MCRALYLLTEHPLSAQVLAWEDSTGVRLFPADLQWIPEEVAQIPHGAIYAIASSQGCGYGFEINNADNPEPEQLEGWQADMQGLGRLLRRVAQEQPAFQLCTGWDFLGAVEPCEIAVDDVEKQHFEGIWYEENGVFTDEWEWLQVRANQS